MEFTTHIAGATKQTKHWDIVLADAFEGVNMMSIPYTMLPKSWKGVWRGAQVKGYGDMNAASNTLIVTTLSLSIPTDPKQLAMFMTSFVGFLGNKSEYLPLRSIKTLSPQVIREIVVKKKLVEDACDLLEQVQQNYENLATFKSIKDAMDKYFAQQPPPPSDDVRFVKSTLTSTVIQATAKKLKFIELQNNPYHLDKSLGTSEAFACLFGLSIDVCAREGVKHILRARIQEHGHTCYPKKLLIARLAADSHFAALKNLTFIENQVDTDEEVVHVPFETTYTYLRYLYNMERDIARNLVRLQMAQGHNSTRDRVDEIISQYEQEHDCQLHGNQRSAILRVLTDSNVITITGFPGTGKSTVTSCLVHVIKTIDPTAVVVMCAPTGKAARRLPGGQGITIHRLIGLNIETNKTVFHSANPIPADFIIIDECSMMDTCIAWRILDAIKTGTKVLFLGDVNQLPSVCNGDVLRSIITSGGHIHTVKLTKIFRQMNSGDESGIVSLSKKIIRSQWPLEPYELNNAEVEWIDEDDPEAILAHIKRLYFDDTPPQILIPCKKTKVGVHEINNIIHDEKFPACPGGVAVGESVICTVNKVTTVKPEEEGVPEEIDHELSYYNGDMGIITQISRGKSMVRMLDDPRHINIENKHLEYSYAKTIHKSQGSEYNNVIVVLHTSHGIMLNKQLFYTAVTRTKRRLVIIAGQAALLKAITQSGVKRFTLLPHFIDKEFSRD
jgi:RecD/TraA family predicted helicase